MSIIRNNRSSNTSITAKVFKSNEAIADGYYPREYVALKGCYLFPLTNIQSTANVQTDGESSVIFKVVIDSTASGYLFGSSDSLNIQVGSGNITWNFNTTLYTMAIPSGVHEIGFVKLTNGIFPIVDGVVPTGASGVSGTVSARRFMVGTAVNSSGSATGDAITSSGTYAIQVREIIGYFLYNGEHYLMHWYAASSGASGTTPYMYETRSPLAIGYTNMTVGGSGTSSLGNAVQYGVQLFDLREITGSGYRDLVALVADDGGIDSAAGWSGVGTDQGQADEPSALSKNGDNRQFAFCLNGLDKPSGWTYAEHYPNTASHGYGYEAGELHTGRQPKWSIWNDCIKFGFHVILNDGKYYMRFNFLKIIDLEASSDLGTKNGKVWLDWFDGYNTAEGSSHPPLLTASTDAIPLHIHNGAFARCLTADVMAGDIGATYHLGGQDQETTHTVTDNICVFFFNDVVGGNVSYRVGNLAPWNYTSSELQAKQYRPKGVMVTAKFDQGQYDFLGSEQMLPSGTFMTKDNTTAKAIYQSQTFSDALKIMANKWYLLDYLGLHQNTANMYVHLNLVCSITGGNQNVDCSRLVPDRKIILSGVYDANVVTNQENSAYRVMVDYHPATSGGMIGCVAGCSNYASSNDNWKRLETRISWRIGVAETTRRYGMFLPFIGCQYNSDNYPVPIYDDVDYVALIECFYMRYNSGTSKWDSYLAICVKDSMTFEQFRNYFESTAYAEDNKPWIPWWGNSVVADTNWKYLWRSNYKFISLESGTNDKLSKKLRIFFPTDQDLGFYSGQGESNWIDKSSVIMHIYHKTAAPIFVVSGGTWDSEHHVVTTTFGSGSTFRRIAYTKEYYVSDYDGNGQTQTFGAVFMAYNSSNEIAAMGNCNIGLYINGTLYATFKVRNFAYYPKDYVHGSQTEGGHTETFDGLDSGGSEIFNCYLDIDNWSVADELVYGFSTNYWQGAYFGLNFEIPTTAVSRGDKVEIRFSNPT